MEFTTFKFLQMVLNKETTEPKVTEKFEEDVIDAVKPVEQKTEVVKTEKKKNSVVFYLLIAAWLLLGAFASFLSWTSNSLIGWNVIGKVFFAFFAFLFNQTYLISHLFHKMDLLQFIQEAIGGVEEGDM